MTLATSCKTEDSKQVTELKKRCAELSKGTGKDYLYGSGELKHFTKIVSLIENAPIAEQSNPKSYFFNDTTPSYAAAFITPERKQIQITIQDNSKNSDTPSGELKSLPITMEIGKTYQFCYRVSKEDIEYYYIDHPETIQLMK